MAHLLLPSSSRAALALSSASAVGSGWKVAAFDRRSSCGLACRKGHASISTGLGCNVDPLLEELIAGTVTMTALGAFLAFLYWAFTGNNPWPAIVLAEVLAFGLGLGIITLCGPRRSKY